MLMEEPIPAASIKAVVNDKLVHGDLASLQWARPGPAGRSALSRRHSAICRTSSTSLVRL